MEETKLPELTAEEIRIIGSMIEKSKVTPDYYPMTINALKNACNQKSSRNPIVEYDEDIIIETIGWLRKKGLVGTMTGGGSRVTKYKHNLSVHYSLDPVDLTILCLLMLRGPLTAGEINSNAGRMYDFDSLDEVNEKLKELSEVDPPFIRMLGRKPGQKENRYIHLFAAFDEEEYAEQLSQTTSSGKEEIDELKNRVENLEEELKRLREEFNQLINDLK